MDLKITYYAILREQRGLSEEVVTIPSMTTSAVYEQLRYQHGFSLTASQLQYAVNDDFVKADFLLKDGDHLVFLPPMAGG